MRFCFHPCWAAQGSGTQHSVQQQLTAQVEPGVLPSLPESKGYPELQKYYLKLALFLELLLYVTKIY